MFLHDIQYLFLYSYQIDKTHPFLHYTQRKSTSFYTIARPIFLKSYSIIHSGFFGLSWLGEECQGLGLWYLLKDSRYLLFKRQHDRKMCRVFAWFSTFCMSLPYLCQILAQTIRLRKDNSKIINSSFSQRVCVYERLLEVKRSGIYSKLKATYVFAFVRSAIMDVSILQPKISTRYHVYDCVWGAAEFIWGFGEHKQNTFRELRQKKFRDLGRSEHYFQGAREQGPPPPPPGGPLRCTHHV